MLQKLYKTSMLFIAALVAMIVWASEEAYAISTPQVTMNNDFANQNATYRIEFTETYASIQKFEIKFPPGTRSKPDSTIRYRSISQKSEQGSRKFFSIWYDAYFCYGI